MDLRVEDDGKVVWMLKNVGILSSQLIIESRKER